MPIYINRQKIETSIFPGGEVNVRVKPTSGEQTVDAYLFNSNDIMMLFLTIDALRMHVGESVKITLRLPYLPYARQDRVCHEGEALSAEVFIKMLAKLPLSELVVWDVHSKAVESMLNTYMNCEVTIFSQAEIIAIRLRFVLMNPDIIMVAPDKGAKHKVMELYGNLLPYRDIDRLVCATKSREPDGKIIPHLKDDDASRIKGKDVIIIDDLCDGGRTFIELAKVLKEAGAKDLYLYVTFGIFSQGLDPLKEYFKKVYYFHTSLPQDQIDENFLHLIRMPIDYGI